MVVPVTSEQLAPKSIVILRVPSDVSQDDIARLREEWSRASLCTLIIDKDVAIETLDEVRRAGWVRARPVGHAAVDRINQLHIEVEALYSLITEYDEAQIASAVAEALAEAKA